MQPSWSLHQYSSSNTEPWRVNSTRISKSHAMNLMSSGFWAQLPKTCLNGKIIVKETLMMLCTHIKMIRNTNSQMNLSQDVLWLLIPDLEEFFVSLTARHTTTLPNPESWRCIRVAEQNPSHHSHAEINSKRIIHQKSTLFICATKTAHTDGFHPTWSDI